MAKSKAVPSKGQVTIPRLELHQTQKNSKKGVGLIG